MNIYYVTSAADMPLGSGYWEVHAETEEEARDIAFKQCPDALWSFLYLNKEDIHPFDAAVCHGILKFQEEEQKTEDVTLYIHDDGGYHIVDCVNRELYDWSSCILVGIYNVKVPIPKYDEASIINKKIEHLKEKKQGVLADAQVKANKIDEEIQSLLAIEYKEEDSDQ